MIQFFLRICLLLTNFKNQVAFRQVSVYFLLSKFILVKNNQIVSNTLSDFLLHQKKKIETLVQIEIFKINFLENILFENFSINFFHKEN